MKILIVDDEPALLRSLERDLRHYIKTILQEKVNNFEIHKANDAKQAVHILKELNHQIDLIISDVFMEHCIFYFLDYLEKNDLQHFPIISMSGGSAFLNDSFEYLELTKELGVKEILYKPFKRNELQFALNSVLHIS